MQTILNNQERNQAFLKFLLFFLLTIVLVVIAIFFNYRLPSKENKLLQDEVDIQRQQETGQQKFVAKMNEVTLLLDSLNESQPGFEILAGQVTQKINELSILQQKDNTPYGKINKALVYVLSKNVEQKKQVKTLLDLNGKSATLQSELETCRRDLATTNQELATYRSSK